MTTWSKPLWSKPWANTGLHALLAAIKSSPIVVRLAGCRSYASEWASVRNSPDVDAYVLAWISSHVRGARRAPRVLM
jgi:hypothetical protein